MIPREGRGGSVTKQSGDVFLQELDGAAFAAAQPDGESAEAAPSGESIPAMLAKAQHAKQVGNEARKRRLDELYTETVAEYRLLAKRLEGR